MRGSRLLLIAGLLAALAAIVTLVFFNEPAAEARKSQGRHRRANWAANPLSRLGSVGSGLVMHDSPDEPQSAHPRIVALAPAAAQIVRDLGCGHLLVGRQGADHWSDPRLTVCGDYQSIDYEHLLAVEPTHIFLQWPKDLALPERLTTLAKENHWSVFNLTFDTLADVRQQVGNIYHDFVPDELKALAWERRHTYFSAASAEPGGVESEQERRLGNAVYTALERLESSLSADATLAGAGRVLLLYQGEGEQGSSSVAALGPGSYHHDMLLALGARSALDQGRPFMPLDAEDIAGLRPDCIILIQPSRKGTEGALSGKLASLDVPAIRSGRTAVIDDPMALIPGTNLARVAERMRALLKGWAGTPLSGQP